MHLLLTRANDDSARLRAKLEALGHTVLASPVIAIEAANAIWPAGVVDALLATSGHAFLALDSAKGLATEARRLMPMLLVGSRTEEGARRHGFAGNAVVEPNAASLAVRIGELVYKPRRIVYLAGRDRKPDIERALHLTGQRFETVETYEARSTDALTVAAVSALRSGSLDGVLHFSRRSAELYFNLATKAGVEMAAVRHVCLSEDVAEPLRQAGLDADAIEAPNESALLSHIGDSVQA